MHPPKQVYQPKKRKEEVQKIDMDPERTTEHIDTLNITLEDRDKKLIVLNNPVEKSILGVPAANGHEASNSRSQHFLPKWCPLGLTRTQRRKLQKLRF